MNPREQEEAETMPPETYRTGIWECQGPGRNGGEYTYTIHSANQAIHTVTTDSLTANPRPSFTETRLTS